MKQSNSTEFRINSSLIDSLLAHVAIIDQEGIILNTNEAWDSFGDEQTTIKRPEKGDNFFNSLQQAIEFGNDYALKMLLGVKKVISGKKDSFSLTYPTNTFWFKLTVRPCDDGQRFVIIQEDISSSIQARQNDQLRKSRYQVQFEQSLDGILITNTTGQVIDANPAACKILGRIRKDLISCSRKDIVDVDDPHYQQALSNRKKTGTYQLETNLIHKKGHKVPVEMSSRAYRTPSGKLRGVVSFRDISRRKKVEHDLKKNQDFTESILDSIPGAFFVLNEDGEFVRWNKNMITKLGYSGEELLYKDVLDFIIEEEKAMVSKKIKQCLEGNEMSLDTKVYNKDGEIREYHVSAKRFVEDDKLFIVGAALDMTDEKRIERENHRNQLMLEQLFSNAPVGIAIADTDNKIRQVNESFQQIFGYSNEELLEQNINEIIVPEDKINEAEALSLATQQGERLQIKTMRSHKSGKKVPIILGSVPVKEGDEIIAIYGIYVDISQQQQYQNKIEEALREKEALLAELHHRVKNNLALINSLLEIQLYESENPNLDNQLIQIKNRILAISSIHEVLYQNGNLQKIPFSEFIQQFLGSGDMRTESQSHNKNIFRDTDEIYLEIDQSIPCGLLLNELIALIFTLTNKDQQSDLNIRLRQYGKQVHLVIDGHDIVEHPREVKNNQSLHKILIDTLTQQLEGTMLWPDTKDGYQKFEFIFTRTNGNRISEELLKQSH